MEQKTLEINHCEEDIEITQKDFDVKFGAKKAEGGISIESINEQRKKDKYEKTKQKPNNSLSEGSYEKAITYAKEYGIDKDPEIERMLKEYTVENIKNNQGSTEENSIELTSELTDLLNITSKLELLGGMLSVSANYKSKYIFKRKIKTKITFEF